uniref:WD_REPEATS_REGION domain-containing protein n=1 Tax=Elaeophora elaphi TaxID=1147741 RepID=A0A0R3RPJ0_9BILA
MPQVKLYLLLHIRKLMHIAVRLGCFIEIREWNKYCTDASELLLLAPQLGDDMLRFSDLASGVLEPLQVIITRLTTESPMSLDDELAPEELSFVGFNQDATSLALGAASSYALYSIKKTDKLDLIHESYRQFSDDKKKNAEVSEIMLIERLFSSSLLMLVSTQAPRKLRIYHFQKNNEICAQSYTNTVLAVRLNRDYMVVCLEDIVYIHTVKDMKVIFKKFFFIATMNKAKMSFIEADIFPVIHTIRDTPSNTSGIVDLSSTVNSFLAYPGSTNNGHVQLFDVTRLNSMNTISAHTSPLAALRFSYDGKKLATASTRGTVIRVFDTESGDRLYEFTRGVKRFVSIYSMAFSIDGNYLCSSSNTETVHVFRLEPTAVPVNENEDDEEQGWVDYLSKQASSYLPTQMNDLWMRGKSFATARLPSVGKRNTVALPLINNKLQLLIATTDGFVYIYPVEAEGGELTLLRQHKVSIKYSPVVHAHDPPDNQSNGDNDGTGSEEGQTLDRHIIDNFPPLNHSTA